jgi:hypothetical protein
MRNIVLAAMAFAVVGCTSYEERVANTCSRLGAPPGSANYWDCVHMQMANDNQQRAMWGGLAAVGAGIAAQPAAQPVGITCTTWSNMTSCR